MAIWYNAFGCDVMTELLVLPINKKMVDDIIDVADGVILSPRELSVNVPYQFFYDDVIALTHQLKRENKKVFINLNKNFNDDDLRRLKIFLLKIKQHLSGLVDGIFYYDIALVHLKEKYDLPFELIWAQEHMTNNYLTCNYWYSKGVSYAQLSNELMLSEIKEIHKHTDMKLVYQVFGYIPMFTSKRPLLSNYIDTYQLYRQGKDYNLYKEGKYYPIVENRDGTVLYTPYMLNALEEYMELRDSGVLSYAILNGYLLKHNVFKRIVGIFHTVNEKNVKELSLEIDQLCKNKTDKGFLYKETVYKVKDYGKEEVNEKA